MVPCLSHFPSVCLETIFKHVPLVDLLTSIGLVCTNWYRSRRTELMRRRQLVIVDDEDDLKSFDRNFIPGLNGVDLVGHVRRDDESQWLTLEPFEKIKFDSLVVARHRLTVQVTWSLMVMPNITHLALMLNRILNANLTQMIRLIEYLSDHLIDLKLHIDCSPPLEFGSDDEDFLGVNGRENETELAIGRNVTNLFACLDRLQSLRHLRLFLVIPQLDLRPQLSFLKRLITLSISVYGINESHFYWCLNRYCTNINSIDLHNMLNFNSNLSQLKGLYTKFNYVSLSYPRFQDYENLALFCTRFSSLAQLKLNGCLMPMTMLARCLSQLRQLVHLDVYVNNPQTEEAQPGEIAQVTSVRLLAIRFDTKSHNDSETLFISEIFPNVQVLRLDCDIRECPECAINPRNYGFLHHIQNSEPELADRLIRCKRLTRQPFRRCANLRTVELASFVGQTVVITANEL